MKLEMKKFFAALSALAIMSLVAVGCKGKDPNPNPPKPTDAITVKKGGKDVTNLELSVGDNVAISTNAASNPEALIVNSSTGAFEVKAEPAGIVEVSKTEIVAKAAGDAKVIFSAGDAKVEVAVKVNKPNGGGEEEIKDENYYGLKIEGEKFVSSPTIYIPTSKKFSEMKDWKAIVTKAMTAKGWAVKNPDLNAGFAAYGFTDPAKDGPLVFGNIWYFYEGQNKDGSAWTPRVMSRSIYGVADKKQDGDEYVKKLPPLEKFAALMGADFQKINEQKNGEWKEEAMNFGNGEKKYQVKEISQQFVDQKRGVILLLSYTVLKDFANASAQYAGCPGSALDFIMIEAKQEQSASALRSAEKASLYMLESMRRTARLRK